MSVMLQSSFSLSNLSCNVDNGNGGSLVAGVHNLDSLKKELSYLEVSIGGTREYLILKSWPSKMKFVVARVQPGWVLRTYHKVDFP